MWQHLAHFYKRDMNFDDQEEYRELAVRLVAKMPTLAAAYYRYSMGYPMIYPDLDAVLQRISYI